MPNVIFSNDHLLTADISVGGAYAADLEAKLRRQLGALDEENATLRQELQHRVGNSLQLVYGMLEGLIKTDDQVGYEGVKEIARRVLALAQVHQHLQGSGLSRTMDSATPVTLLETQIF